MRPGTKTLATSLGLAVAWLVFFAASACAGDEQRQEEEDPKPLPEVRQALRPGEYRSEEFEPSLSFRVGKGWSNTETQLPDSIEVGEVEQQEETGWINFVNVQEVFKPGTRNVVKAPKNLVGWYQHHPYLKTSKPEPVTVGGVKGVQIDVLVEDLPQDVYGRCGVECVDVAPLSGGEQGVFFKEANKRRVIVLEDLKGETVTIDFSTPVVLFDKFAPEAQKVIDTVKWGGS